MNDTLIDGHGRRIDYLRLSITDRCNLRCQYCMPTLGVPKLRHDEMLSYEEMLRVADLLVTLGISKIRITGGEPLVRKGSLYFCERIAAINGLQSVSLTTNGVLLEELAEGLSIAGIQRINISLDSLDPRRYASITRRDCFHQVWRGILKAAAIGLSPVKLNTVIMRGINDDEVEDLAGLTYQHPFHVRFIELMPMNGEAGDDLFMGSDEILARLSAMGPLTPVSSSHSNGPARHFRLAGAMGKIGIISPISHHFCPSCNRLRLTADGKLRTCLFATQETDLRPYLRQGASDAEILERLREAILTKPERHALTPGGIRKCINRPMVAIGG
ncbi:MAG: GTP 3',8-cyclase MoaA [Syntrophobacteraceae bacterium]|jgi:cyclic pyranopterin phosphate synthase|nr:GTP 3',8-cyclase MoaA [Syntrophobacteraceae bacterium]